MGEPSYPPEIQQLVCVVRIRAPSELSTAAQGCIQPPNVGGLFVTPRRRHLQSTLRFNQIESSKIGFGIGGMLCPNFANRLFKAENILIENIAPIPGLTSKLKLRKRNAHMAEGKHRTHHPTDAPLHTLNAKKRYPSTTPKQSDP